MNSRLKISIVGATSYTGNEIFRLLLTHPHVEIISLTSESKAGQSAQYSLASLRHNQSFNKQMKLVSINDISESDVIFSCLPTGVLPEHINQLSTKAKIIINLSGDYRFTDTELLNKYYANSLFHPLPNQYEYIIPEFSNSIPTSGIINLPGCMAVASLYAIYPLVKQGLIENKIILDVKTGSSGAGKNSKENSSERSNNFRPHKLHGHKHAPEIQMAIKKYLKSEIDLQFSTYSLDIARGILVSAYTTLKEGVTEIDVRKAFYREYENTSFIRYLNGKQYEFPYPMIKTVSGTNHVEVGTSVLKNSCVSVVTLDNLIKGAAGQAIQLMNKIFQFPESTSLCAGGLWP